MMMESDFELDKDKRGGIVVDVGCLPHGPEVSIEPLIERFAPLVLFGFDPHPSLSEGVAVQDGTTIVARRLAAGIKEGTTDFALVEGERSWDSTTTRQKNSRGEWSDPSKIQVVETFDLAVWLSVLPDRMPVVLKIDAEGAEYQLIERVHSLGVDARLALILVEWHHDKMENPADAERWADDLMGRLRCPIDNW